MTGSRIVDARGIVWVDIVPVGRVVAGVPQPCKPVKLLGREARTLAEIFKRKGDR